MSPSCHTLWPRPGPTKAATRSPDNASNANDHEADSNHVATTHLYDEYDRFVDAEDAPLDDVTAVRLHGGRHLFCQQLPDLRLKLCRRATVGGNVCCV